MHFQIKILCPPFISYSLFYSLLIRDESPVYEVDFNAVIPKSGASKANLCNQRICKFLNR